MHRISQRCCRPSQSGEVAIRNSIVRRTTTKDILAVSFLLLISAIVYNHLLNFGVHSNADWSFRFAHTLKDNLQPSIWLSNSDFGAVNITLWRFPLDIFFGFLSLAGFASSRADFFLVFLPLAITSSLAPYIFLRLYVENRIAAIFGSLIFCYNTYYLAISTQGQMLLALAGNFALLGIASYVLWSRKHELIYLIGAGVALAAAGYEDFRLVYLSIAVIAALYLYRLLVLKEDSLNWRAIYQHAIFFGILLGLNFFWLMPSMAAGGISGDAALNRSLFGNQFWNLPNSLSLTHPFWNGTLPQWFVVQPIKYIAWIVPGIVLLALIINRRRNDAAFWAIVAVVGVFLGKQVGQPLGGIYPWLFAHVPGFNAFREPTKFYFFIAIGYAVLIALVLEVLISFTTKRYIYVYYLVCLLLALVTVKNVWPVVTGAVQGLYQNKSIPSDYKILNSFLARQKGFFRTYWIPTTSAWGVYSNQQPRISGRIVGSVWAPFTTPLLVGKDDQNQQRIVDILADKFSSRLLGDASVRYVIVPSRDIANNDDFFSQYGDDRQYFINALNQVSFLRRINIGTRQLAIYQNTSMRPYISASSSVYGLHSAAEISGQLPLLTQTFAQDFYIPTKQSTDRAGTGFLSSLFDTQVGDPNGGGELRQRATLPANTTLYVDQNTDDLFYSVRRGALRLYTQHIGGLKLNGRAVDGGQSVTQVARVGLSDASGYYIGSGSQLQWVNPAQPGRQWLGRVRGPTTIYAALHRNALGDSSFEQGLWQPKVKDCNDYDKQAAISMSLGTGVATNGEQSLQLESTNHTACTSQQNIAVRAGMAYLFKFDYRNFGGQKAGYKLSFNDPKRTAISQDLWVNSSGWRTLMRAVDVPAGATRASLQLFGYPDENFNNDSFTFYDNFRLSELRPQLVVPAAGSGFRKIALPAEQVTFTYRDTGYPMRNLIPNPSFERGLWQKTVGDCHDYDSRPQINMKLDSATASSGSSSLELDASRHTACTGPAQPIPVTANSTYLLSFDYQSPNGSSASYYVSFDDPAKTAVSKTIEIKGKTWQHYVTSLQVPGGTSALALAVYASPGSSPAVVRYDNFKLVEIPDVLHHYYLVTQPRQAIIPPRRIRYRSINPSKKVIHVSGATTPFYLVMSEAYNPSWRLELVSGLHSWSPFTQVDAVPAASHVDLNDFENGWYVNPARLCKDHVASCTHNADGSYNLSLVAEFAPQRWFYFGAVVSGLTLIVCVGSVAYYYKKACHGREGTHYVARR